MKVKFIWNLVFVCLLTICFLCSFHSQAQAQCDRDLHIDLDYDATGHVSSGSISCDTMPTSAIAKTTGGREIMVTFSGGVLTGRLYGPPYSVYATFPLIDNSNNNHNPCPSNNGFGTQMQMNFAEPVAYVDFALFNDTDVSQTYTVTSGTETQQITIAAHGKKGIGVGQDLAQNTISNITVESTSNNGQWAYSFYGLFTIFYYDETDTKAGTLQTYPEEVAGGGIFSVIGFNWLNLGPPNFL